MSRSYLESLIFVALLGIAALAEAERERDMANEYIGRAREHINAQLGIRTPFFDDLIVLAVNYALDAAEWAASAAENARIVREEIPSVALIEDPLRGGAK